ncbi:MAG: T9SS type A sorting domain-containing protein [Bacteroidales bacterium]|nr:T9SS type A sorting domain-containing protein [Bacteroidales bacterium]
MKKFTLLILIINCLFIKTNAQNNCLNFDGTNDYVDIGTGPGTVKTVEFWVNPASTTEYLIDLNATAFIWINSGTVTAAGFSDPTIYVNGVSATSISANIWQHITVTTITGINADDFDIGRQGSNFLTGKIDEVRIWNDVRTEMKIRENMYKELVGTEDGLVAYYKMNSSNWTTAIDSKGSYSGTLINMAGTEWTPSSAFSDPKNCLDFDGSDDYVDCGASAVVLGNTFTQEAWIYPIHVGAGPSFLYHGFLGFDDDGGGTDNDRAPGIWLVEVDGNSSIAGIHYGFSSGGGWYSECVTNVITYNKWYHVVTTFDGTNYLLYVNGIEVNNYTGASGKTPYEIPQQWIGRVDNAAKFFKGKIDEVRIWDDVRTPIEIRENMCKSLVGNEAGLAAYYNFDNCLGTKLQDFSGDDNDGVLQNMENADWVSSTAFNTWLNTNSTSWSIVTNWSRGSAPTSTDNVGIPDYSTNGGSDPIISSIGTCNNLVVEGTLTFDFNDSHTIHGSAFVIGHSDIKNDSKLEVTGSLYILPLSSLSIEPRGQLTIGKKFDNWSGTCTLKSDETNSASMIVGESTSGNVTFERYIPSGKWHYISCPIIYNSESTQFDDLSMDLGTPGSSSNQFYRWDESLSGKTIGYWVDILNGADGTGNNTLMDDEVFNLAQGYGIYYASSPKTLSLKNEMNISNKTYTITKTSGSTNEGSNLVGNPFCSDIAINTGADTDNNFINQNSSALDESYEAIYLWQEDGSWDGKSKDYVTINNSSGATFIEPGQAFMIMANSNDASLAFNSSIRKHGAASFYKNCNNENISRFELGVINPENENNTTLIAFIPAMTNGLDPSYDAAKFSGNPNLSLYTKLLEPNEHDFAIQALPLIENNPVEIKIGLKAMVQGEYTFKAVNIENFEENICIKLEDKLTGEIFNLRTQTEYSFTIYEQGTYNNRFLLHFNGVTGIENQEQESEKIRFYVYDNKLYIIDKELQKGTIQLFNMLGQPVMEKQFSEAVNILDLNLKTGYYVVRIITEKGIVSGKVFFD